MTYIGILMAALVFGVITASLARARSLKPRFWFFWGVVGGPLTLIAILLLPKDWLSDLEKS